ncbi:hypothetical protein EVAR_3244_1 [Eumeta japonica]|uniref:Secreted protein n=1 Tax=Eumeta variegata TaxID=151549 RepID=A0A4C1SUY9_EUMVA|nr:hypothetical protein EVAR_3244_1 [Eumeta japonica]
MRGIGLVTLSIRLPSVLDVVTTLVITVVTGPRAHVISVIGRRDPGASIRNERLWEDGGPLRKPVTSARRRPASGRVAGGRRKSAGGNAQRWTHARATDGPGASALGSVARRAPGGRGTVARPADRVLRTDRAATNTQTVKYTSTVFD